MIPPLAPPKGRSSSAAFQVISDGQAAHFVEIGVLVVPEATLERSPGPVVLHPVAPEDQDRAVVGPDGHLDVELAVGLGQEDPDVLFEVEQGGGAVDVLPRPPH